MSVELEKLAGLIGNRWPDKWRAEFQYPGEAWENLAIWPAGNGFATVWFCPIADDSRNAYFIIWCLDRLQEIWDGHWTRAIGSNIEYSVDLIGNSATGEGFFIEVTVYPESDAHAVARTYPAGKSRAECCANALLSALSEEQI